MLTAGPTPDIAAENWGFRIDGMVGREQEWTWEEFHRLPFETVPCDIHCVTKWSKLGTSFGGVSLDTLLEGVEPRGAYAMAYSYGGALLDRLTPVEQRAPGRWQIGTVAAIKRETPRVKSFRIDLPMWMPHLPGQHYSVRSAADVIYAGELEDVLTFTREPPERWTATPGASTQR